MRFCILFIVLLPFGHLLSQNVFFPDPNFKNKLLESAASNTIAKNLQGAYFAIDANGDGEIQVSEATQVSELHINSNYIYQIHSFVGIESFSNLEYLDFSGSNQIEEVVLTNFQHLTEVKVAPCTSLKKLIITDNPLLTEINFECYNGLDELDTLDCSRNNLSILNLESGGNFSKTPPLKYLDFSHNHISFLDIEDLNLLRYLDLSENEFTDLEFHNMFHLEQLFIDNNPLVTLNLSYNSVDTLIISNFPNLVSIDVSGVSWISENKINDLQLAGLPSLEYLNCAYNALTQLTLSDLPSLRSFDMEDMEMDLTLHNLPAITNLDFAEFELINKLSISALDNLTKIKIVYWDNIHLSDFVISDMENLSVADFRLNTEKFSITNSPSLDTLLFVNSMETPDLIFEGLTGLKYLDVAANVHDSTILLNNLPSLDYFRIASPGINSLQVADLPALSTLLINAVNLRSLDIANVPNFRKLEMINTPNIENLVLTDIPLQVLKAYYNEGFIDNCERGIITFGNLPQLDSIYIRGIGITSLDLSNLPNLHDIQLLNLQRVEPLTFSGLPKLHSLLLNRCWLNTLIVSGLENLEDLTIHNINYDSYGFNTLTAFEVSGLPNLSYLSIIENEIPPALDINITDFPELYTLVYEQFPNHLTLSDLPSLANLSLKTPLTTDTVQFSGFPSLHTFYFETGGYKSIQLTNLPRLEQLNIQMYEGEVDLSGCPSLDILNLGNWRTLDFLNLKNGNSLLSSFHSDHMITSICVDSEAEAELIRTLAPHLTASNFTTDCETQPCQCNKITGTILYDLGNNDCLNSTTPCANTKVIISGNYPYETFTDSTGSFWFFSQSLNENIVITPVFEDPYFIANPVSATVSFDTYGNVSSTDFCVGAQNEHNDLEVFVSSINAPRPGFDLNCNIDFKNKGTSSVDGSVNFYFDDEVMNIVLIDPPYDTYYNNCLSWNFTGLNPFEMRNISIIFNLNTPIEVPPLNGGDILEFKAEILPVENDENPDDNTFILHQEVINSYDPNDKTCLEGSSINLEKVGEYVHYLIRFENTGNADAVNIKVRDVIDTTKFDMNSFVFLNSSHVCECKITQGNFLEFMFDKIHLPHGEGKNRGFINFKIKTVTSLELNDVFMNMAMIYFDFNAPIYTDNCKTVVLLNVNTEDIPLSEHKPVIYPNPVHDILHIFSEDPVTKVEIIDLNGRLLKTYFGKNSIPTHDLKKGVYLVKIFKGLKSFIFKVVKV